MDKNKYKIRFLKYRDDLAKKYKKSNFIEVFIAPVPFSSPKLQLNMYLEKELNTEYYYEILKKKFDANDFHEDHFVNCYTSSYLPKETHSSNAKPMIVIQANMKIFNSSSRMELFLSIIDPVIEELTSIKNLRDSFF